MSNFEEEKKVSPNSSQIYDKDSNSAERQVYDVEVDEDEQISDRKLGW